MTDRDHGHVKAAALEGRFDLGDGRAVGPLHVVDPDQERPHGRRDREGLRFEVEARSRLGAGPLPPCSAVMPGLVPEGRYSSSGAQVGQ